MTGERWARWGGWLAIGAVLVAFLAHRVTVLLSAGDVLFPIEPWEGKNTQIAWDLLSGRYGTPGYDLRAYIANSGSVHHAAYSSTAAAYVVLSRVAGYGLLSVRLLPLLFWTAALAVWMGSLRAHAGAPAAVAAGVGLALVPAGVIGWQLTFFGCHAESVLPLAAAVASALAWRERPGRGLASTAVAAACFSYAAAFSYLLWPLLAVLAVAIALPPRPRLDRRALAAALGGALIGAWPLLLIAVLDGGALLRFPVTEDADTRLVDLVGGQGADGALLAETWRTALRGFPDDYWVVSAEPGAPWGRERFEAIAWRVTLLGPLLLVPFAWRLRKQTVGRLGLFVALAPLAGLLFVVLGSPFRPDIPRRYLLAAGFVGWSAPGVAIGLGRALVREARGYRPARAVGWLVVAAGVATLGWFAPVRLSESAALVRLDRADALLRHRYVTYYNLGIGTIWAEQVDEVNDLIDIRSADADPASFGALQAGLLHDHQPVGLGRLPWRPLPYAEDSMLPGLAEWWERQAPRAPADRELGVLAARNVGWGAGIRARWDADAVWAARAFADAEGRWPQGLSVEAFWEGYGSGWGRTHDGDAAGALDGVDALDDDARAAVLRGVAAGRALGDPPAAPREPVFVSIRGPAT